MSVHLPRLSRTIWLQSCGFFSTSLVLDICGIIHWYEWETGEKRTAVSAEARALLQPCASLELIGCHWIASVSIDETLPTTLGQ